MQGSVAVFFTLLSGPHTHEPYFIKSVSAKTYAICTEKYCLAETGYHCQPKAHEANIVVTGASPIVYQQRNLLSSIFCETTL